MWWAAPCDLASLRLEMSILGFSKHQLSSTDRKLSTIADGFFELPQPSSCLVACAGLLLPLVLLGGCTRPWAAPVLPATCSGNGLYHRAMQSYAFACLCVACFCALPCNALCTPAGAQALLH